ncbi:unnamed protein product [Acanthosepion pharaonis]|uniref:Uncharacterized protein n=1 Tax=Acanthosepion pharaonis TaxID=158019 RepID=A0A812BBX4_ACAPH|nr:unnamed protein product [Sepia pharaonis]
MFNFHFFLSSLILHYFSFRCFFLPSISFLSLSLSPFSHLSLPLFFLSLIFISIFPPVAYSPLSGDSVMFSFLPLISLSFLPLFSSHFYHSTSLLFPLFFIFLFSSLTPSFFAVFPTLSVILFLSLFLFFFQSDFHLTLFFLFPFPFLHISHLYKFPSFSSCLISFFDVFSLSNSVSAIFHYLPYIHILSLCLPLLHSLSFHPSFPLFFISLIFIYFPSSLLSSNASSFLSNCVSPFFLPLPFPLSLSLFPCLFHFTFFFLISFIFYMSLFSYPAAFFCFLSFRFFFLYSISFSSHFFPTPLLSFLFFFIFPSPPHYIPLLFLFLFLCTFSHYL